MVMTVVRPLARHKHTYTHIYIKKHITKRYKVKLTFSCWKQDMPMFKKKIEHLLHRNPFIHCVRSVSGCIYHSTRCDYRLSPEMVVRKR